MDRSQDEPCELCGPAIKLTRGGSLQLRHMTEDDVAGLLSLYRRLQPNDLRRRFFTAGPPSTMFLERWTSLHGEDGFGLVVELSDGQDMQLVGEAGYAQCGTDGVDHELGITVAPGSRGWLGPWLLDRLLAHAAKQGLANLQAVVLTDNRAMLALAAKRGFAILGHPDRGLIRLTMATSGSVPSWPGKGAKPRVLIETDRTRWVGEEALIAAGFDIAICAESCRGGHSCPVAEGDPCPLITDADAVIVDLRDDRAAEELLNHERIVHPGVKQIVANHSESARDGANQAGSEVQIELDVNGVVDQIRGLLAADAQSEPAGPEDRPPSARG